MIGGLMKSTSHYALAAAAGLFVGALAITPAKAADLGGDCCADLEERVAELEATTVRKGNRVVSLQMYGNLNRAILIWDDGVEDDIYHVDNDHSSTKIGIRGTGGLKPGWTVGYDIQWNVQIADTSEVDQTDFSRNDSGRPVAWDIRRAETYVESAQFGRITTGQGSAASDGSSEVDLAFANYSSDTLYNTRFILRGADPVGDLRWGELGSNLDGAGRTLRIRYDSPSIYGFILSASAGNDDYWDVALRFSKEWNSVRFAAAVAYSEFDDDSGKSPDFDILSGSASILHTPSGLFLSVAGARRDTDAFTETVAGCESPQSLLNGDAACSQVSYESGTEIDLDEDLIEYFSDAGLVSAFGEDYDRAKQEAWFYWLKGGVSRDFTGMGATTIFGAYGQYRDFAKGRLIGLEFDEVEATIVDDEVVLGSTELESGYRVTKSKVTRYAFGINQTFASAATDIYAHFEYNEADIDAIAIAVGEEGGIVDAPEATAERLETKDWWGIIVGTNIKF